MSSLALIILVSIVSFAILGIGLCVILPAYVLKKALDEEEEDE